MKRIIALLLAVLMVAALFCACGEKKKSDKSGSDSSGSDTSTVEDANTPVKTTVDAKYDQGFAEHYAKSVTTDDSGNKVYEFDKAAYDEYAHDYNNNLSDEITDELVKSHDSSYGQYAYINDEKKAAIIGLNPGQYDEEVAAEEAQVVAQSTIQYFKGLAEPIDKVSVIYCNANNQSEVYGTFEFPVE